MDDYKHYFIDEKEQERLKRYGEGWLDTHPMRDVIYKKALRFSHLLNEAPKDKHISLNTMRYEAIAKQVQQLPHSFVIDIGAGEGKLTDQLAQIKTIDKLYAVDPSNAALTKMTKRFREADFAVIPTIQWGSLYYEEERFREANVFILCEVIEHINEERLPQIMELITGTYAPKSIIITTPNAEYNQVYALQQMRHDDHRFEWTRTEFQAWCKAVAPQYNLHFEGMAHSLIDKQYANVSEQAFMDRHYLLNKLQATANVGVRNWVDEYSEKLKNAARFDAVYKNYCWPTKDVKGIQIAPFHILAHSGTSHFDKPHTWHMEMNTFLAENSSLFLATEYRLIETEQQEEEVINWWKEMTEHGHEGIVIKPLTFVSERNGKLLQPAIKVRGREYLRIIYGMDYTDKAQLQQLKKRNPSRKMRNALLEFKLGMEGIERFVQLESSTRVHECVLATLALESEAVDPRL